MVRVRVEDSVQSYWPVMQLDSRWGSIASDAIAVTFTRGDVVQRIWAIPFAPKGSELFGNAGIGEKRNAADSARFENWYSGEVKSG